MEFGIGAKIQPKEESKLAEAVVFMKSSMEQLEHVQGLFRSELMPDILNTSVKIQVRMLRMQSSNMRSTRLRFLQWRKNAELTLDSYMEWNFDEQARMKMELAMVTPSMNMAKFQLSHDTQWASAQYSETSGTLQIDKSNYGFVLKGNHSGTRSVSWRNFIQIFFQVKVRPTAAAGK